MRNLVALLAGGTLALLAAAPTAFAQGVATSPHPAFYGGRYEYGNNYYRYVAPNSYFQVDTSPEMIRPATTVPDMRRRANITVHVPQDAVVKINGQRMTQTGEMRHFYSPELAAGWNYLLNVEASWMQNGQSIRQMRPVTFHAGETLQVDLMQAPNSKPAGTQPSAN